MSYYQFNRQKVLQKAKDTYHNCGRKEKAAEHYIPNKAFFLKKKEAKNKKCNLSEYEKNS